MEFLTEKKMRGICVLLKLFLVSFMAGSQIGGCGGGDDGGAAPPETPWIYTVVTPLMSEPDRGLRIYYGTEGHVDGFELQVSQGDGVFTDLATLPPSSGDRSYDHWGLGILESHVYRIRAFNAAGVSGWSGEVWGSTTDVQSTVLGSTDAIADAYVDEGQPARTLGVDDTYYLLVTLNSSEYGKAREAYVKFRLDNIPSYATGIRNATVRMFSQNEGVSGPTVHLHIALSDWDENTITWSNKPGKSFYGIALNQDVMNNGQPQFWDITQAVRDWFDGIEPHLNYGIVIVSADSASSTRQAVLYSSERDPVLRPQLTIEYEW